MVGDKYYKELAVYHFLDLVIFCCRLQVPEGKTVSQAQDIFMPSLYSGGKKSEKN